MNDTEILRITTTLGDGIDSYYVYMLCENVNGINMPFYIGKGTGNRILQHELGAEQELEERKKEIVKLLSSNKTLSKEESSQQEEELLKNLCDDINEKYKKINELGVKNVIKIIVKWGLTEAEAFMAESALINAYSLTNGRTSLTNIVNGHMSKRENANVSCSTKARTLQEFLDDCAVEKKCITSIKEPTLFLKIKDLYPQCMQLSQAEQEQAIYDSCRACWILNKNKIKYIKYVFALYNSQVVGIYRVNEDSWKQRHEIDDSFPIFPTDKRQPEIKFGNIAKECDTLDEMKTKCDNYNAFLRLAKIDEDNNNKFKAWKNRYYFNKSYDEIPEDILSFKNCIIVKPNGNKFFSEKGNRSENMYNFELKKGEITIKTDLDYQR